jgi:hypothetical protein
MKRIMLYISFIMAAFTAAAQAPDPDEQQSNLKKEKDIEALYVAYVSQQLKLTPEEAQKFWPIHAQYNEELKAINKSNLSEIDRDQAVLNVKKKYVGNFNKILGNERCNNFYKQDAAFRDRLRNRLKELRQKRRMENQNQQGGGIRRKNMQQR